MEHLIQYTINVDDENIIKHVEKSAYDDIVSDLIKEAKAVLPRKSGYSYWNKNKDEAIDWRAVVEDSYKDFLEEHKEEIIESTVQKLAESIKRTKKYRESVADTIDSEKD